MIVPSYDRPGPGSPVLIGDWPGGPVLLQLEDPSIERSALRPGELGSFDPVTRTITLDRRILRDPRLTLETYIHELLHVLELDLDHPLPHAKLALCACLLSSAIAGEGHRPTHRRT